MKLRYTLPLFLITTPAFAQQPAWVPFTVDQAAALQLQQILNHNVPADFASPVFQWINAMEKQAIEEKMRESATKPEPKADKK